MKLSVQVTDDLILDAGTAFETESEIVITPPEKPMFDQIWDWLEAHPQRKMGCNNFVLGIGATALCYRWGTYLSFLIDDNKPVDPRVREDQDAFGMISQDEMARINIESSSNLEKLLRKLHENEDQTLDFIQRAYDWLPMPHKRVKSNKETAWFIRTTLEVARKHEVDRSGEHFQGAVQYPYRSLANTIAVLAYRDGPIEDIHHGKTAAYSMNLKRMTVDQVREVMKHTAQHMTGVLGARPIWHDDFAHLGQWPERLENLPYIPCYPTNWSLLETSAKVTHKKEWC